MTKYYYHEGPYLDELYTKHQPLVEKHEFDPKLAGADRIGREAKALIAPDNTSFVTDLLDSPEQLDLLAADMGGLVRETAPCSWLTETASPDQRT